MSAEVALEALRLYGEFEISEAMLEDITADTNRGDKHRFLVENGIAVLRSGGDGIKGGYTEHGEFEVDLVPVVSNIIDSYLATRPKYGDAEKYVLGLYMNDPKRDEDIVTALAEYISERHNDV